MSLEPRKQCGFRIPLKKIVIGDFDEAVKRIKAVRFLPDSIIIETIFPDDAVTLSIVALKANIVGTANEHFYATNLFDLSVWYFDENIIYFCPKNTFFSIPLPGAEMLILTNGIQTKIYRK